MFLFPLVGALLGLLAGIFGWTVSFFLPTIVTGAMALGVLLLLTGLHHTDGLLDFGDAVMYHGTRQRKIEIMHDQLTGAGAIGLGLMTYIITAITLGSLNQTVSIGGISVPIIFPALIVIEACAKLSMVIGTWAGKAVHQGMNSPFMDAMHGANGNLRFVVALTLTFLVAVPLLWIVGFFTVLAAILVAFSMVLISHRHFGGVTGDVLGASNEITRMICVVVLLAML
jgi:adenosylcobinamide-GDP ribazoletransferase